MTCFRYPYTRVSRSPSVSPLLQFKNQPLLTIGLVGKSGQVAKISAYIDTGSQWCLFSKQYAPHLGINDFRNTTDDFPLTGIAGPGKANHVFFHDLTLLVFKDTKKLKRDNAIEIPTKIGFVEQEFGFGGILGVYGFLDRFKFIGNIPESYFELEQIL